LSAYWKGLGMDKLNEKEREYIRNTIGQACLGTPLQPNAVFAGQYLGTIVIGILDNWDVVKNAIKEDQ
jgi:hypothetical protein